MKHFYKSLKIFLIFCILFSLSSIQLTCFAAKNKVTLVKTSDELVLAVSSAKDGDIIKLEDDIVLNESLLIKSSITVDLRFHKIIIRNPDVSIRCTKHFNITEDYVVNHAPHWTTKYDETIVPAYSYTDVTGKVVNVPPRTTYVSKRVLVPGWNEHKKRTVTKYCDDINVTIKNGTIVKTAKIEGENGIYNSFSPNGQDAKCTAAPISVYSGTLNLEDMKIAGADGGKGGNGNMGKLWHIPFFTGHGGNGGNGADGSPAVYVFRSEVKVSVDELCILLGGKGGKGGRAGRANPNYWLFAGKKGQPGVDGHDAGATNQPENIYYVKNS